MRSASGRTEKRNHWIVPIQWWTFEQPTFALSGTTENLSPHGARIVTSRNLQPSEHLLVAMPGMRSRLEATVVYCHAVGKGVFQAGVHFRKDT